MKCLTKFKLSPARLSHLSKSTTRRCAHVQAPRSGDRIQQRHTWKPAPRTEAAGGSRVRVRVGMGLRRWRSWVGTPRVIPVGAWQILPATPRNAS